jgi:hypothetical protein
MAEQNQKEDPAIRRVQDARRTISAEHGHDPKQLIDYYLKRQQDREAGAKTSARRNDE